jgi:hypothetical protein
MNRVSNRFRVDLSSANAVNDFDRGVDSRVFSAALGSHFDVVAGHSLTLLRQNPNDVSSCAAAKGYEQEFHWSCGCNFLVSEAGDNGMAARRFADKLFSAGVAKVRNPGFALWLVGHDSPHNREVES